MLVSIRRLLNWKKLRASLTLFLVILSLGLQSAPKKVSEEALHKKTEVLTKVLKYGTSLERKAALMEIEKLPEELQKQFLSQVLESIKKERDPTMKLAFLRVIGNLDIKDAVDEVYKALEDENEDIARAAVASLKKIKPENAWEKVLERLKKTDLTKNSNLTVSLIEALGDLDGGEGAFGYLEDKIKEKFNSHEIRSQIALYFGKKKILAAEIALQQIAFDDTESLTLRTYSINSLGKIGSESSSPKLKEMIENIRDDYGSSDSRKNQLLKIYALGALVSLGNQDVFDEIVEFTKDDDSLVRLRAIHFLKESKRPEAREILEYKSMRDPSPRVQKAAKDALKSWDNPDGADGTNIEDPTQEDTVVDETKK